MPTPPETPKNKSDDLYPEGVASENWPVYLTDEDLAEMTRQENAKQAEYSKEKERRQTQRAAEGKPYRDERIAELEAKQAIPEDGSPPEYDPNAIEEGFELDQLLEERRAEEGSSVPAEQSAPASAEATELDAAEWDLSTPPPYDPSVFGQQHGEDQATPPEHR